MGRISSSLLFALAATAVSVPALAQDPCEEPLDEQYLEMMQETRAAIDGQDYDTALGLLQAAREQYEPAVLDYAIARAHHHLDRFEEAEAGYNTFLRRFEDCPDPNELAAAARRYRGLAIEQQAAALETSEGQPPTQPPPDDGLNPGWIVLSAGGALLIGGVIYDLANAGLDDDLQAAYDANDVTTADKLEGDRDTAELVDIVLYGAGLAAIATGVVLLVVLDDEEQPATDVPQVGWTPRSGGAVVTLGLPF